jgi:hypothetical protein
VSRSDRDPLFFPPQKYPEDPEQEGYSVDVDTASQEKSLRAIIILAVVALVIVLAVLKSDTLRTMWSQARSAIAKMAERAPSASEPAANAPLDSLPAQLQAQRLLQRAAQRQPGALDEINKRLPSWHGKLRLDDPLWNAIGAAFNSNDLAVRTAAVQVDMLARGIDEKPETVDRMIAAAEPGQSNRPAALWALGELAYRQQQPDQARQAIMTYVHDPQQDIRFWAVSSLAMTGQDEAMPPLLDVLRNDPSPKVREEAARDVAVSGMFSPEQRRQAIPELLDLAGDPQLANDSRQWVFHALRDITGQKLPNDAGAWRQWYSASK